MRHLAQVRAENFRLFGELSLRPHPRLNLFTGANAAGKTSLLELLYCLGRGKSFRGNSPAELAGLAGRRWRCAGAFRDADQPETNIDINWTPVRTEIRVHAESTTAAELVRILPVQILEPGMHRLLQEGPGYRRAFLDWGVFHVEPSFFEVWRRYQKALRQRNHGLRMRAVASEIHAWDRELLSSGLELDRLRREHLAEILPEARSLAAQFLGIEDLELELRPGWMGGADFEHRLRDQRARDRVLGLTSEGPHRAELLIRTGTQAVKNRISRGQQKLLIAALLLAQCGLIHRRAGRAPLVVVDDFTAELAEPFQAKLLTALRTYPGQVFVTAFERSGPLKALDDAATFHVEQGRLRPLQC